jgi:hypothetical protein
MALNTADFRRKFQPEGWLEGGFDNLEALGGDVAQEKIAKHLDSF